MKFKTARLVVYILYALVVILAGLTLTFGRLFFWVALGVLAAIGIMQYFFLRCPHCGEMVLHTRPNVLYCPYCSRPLDEEGE